MTLPGSSISPWVTGFSLTLSCAGVRGLTAPLSSEWMYPNQRKSPAQSATPHVGQLANMAPLHTNTLSTSSSLALPPSLPLVFPVVNPIIVLQVCIFGDVCVCMCMCMCMYVCIDCESIKIWLVKSVDESETANYIMANTKDVCMSPDHTPFITTPTPIFCFSVLTVTRQ